MASTQVSGAQKEPSSRRIQLADGIPIYTLGSTPIKSHVVNAYVESYPNKQDGLILANGFQFGFSLQYSGPRTPREANNLKSANQAPHILRQKIDQEVSLNRVAGPFSRPPFPTLQVSPLGLVPKKDGDFRVIHHLSYPDNASINSYIDEDQCSVHYSTIDDAALLISNMGQGALLAKSDVKSAFRLIPIAASDFDVLGFKFENHYYFDKMLPFGSSISCALWEKFASFLHWLTEERNGHKPILHYLDDFLFVGKAGASDCDISLSIFLQICQELGVPIAIDKTVQPTTTLVYLGIEFDTINMVMRLPQDKLAALKQLITSTLDRKKIELRQLQSLIGSLNFTCRVVAPGRAFCRRLINATIGVNKPFFKIRVTNAMKEDLHVWLSFLTSYNGVTVIPNTEWLSNETIQLFTDSAGGPNGGFGIYFNGKWSHGRWPASWAHLTTDMTLLEFFPVVVALNLWGAEFTNKKILFHIDNLAVVHVINSQTTKSDKVLKLLRKLILICLTLNIQIKAEHIFSKLNTIADCLSRSQWGKFRLLAPTADPLPTPVPAHLWQI